MRQLKIFKMSYRYNLVVMLLLLGFSFKSFSQTHTKDVLKFPKTIVYSGVKIPLFPEDYFNLGFTHIDATFFPKDQVSNSKKYILWTGIAENSNKEHNWSRERSPFGNDLHKYEKFWNNRLTFYHDKYYNQKDTSKIGMIVLDIETKKTKSELIKTPPLRETGENNSDKAIQKYKKAMRELYFEPISYAKKHHDNYRYWSSYGDVPIERSWWNISTKSWDQWTKDPMDLNYVTSILSDDNVKDSEFLNSLDFLSVSSYFFYSPQKSNKKVANQYLAYLLFQIEANMAWTKKPIYVYQSFKYYGNKESGDLIDAKMVKNAVIFSFMTGAEGIIVWEGDKNYEKNSGYDLLFNTFTESIELLSKYKDYFIGEIEFYRPDNPRDLFTDKKPVIRGVEKNGKLLIAAVNPYANPKEVTKISFTYKGKCIKFKLIGADTYLNEIVL